MVQKTAIKAARTAERAIQAGLIILALTCAYAPLSNAQDYQITGTNADAIDGTISCAGTDRLTKIINVPDSLPSIN